ncbi:DUF2850 domain-containing protein [Celerinatantimonas yamalensis]|uniref:DUF2850 domain-containing protein n=1 Tax=Celerinatantimonas yamalensis TaxID=559956 RepID=A0ABW9G5A6_9GAMM
MVKTKQVNQPLIRRRRLVILLLAATTLVVAAVAVSYYGFYYHPQIVNPLVGRWRSAEPYFGKTEELVFTERGVLRHGSLINTQYKIQGRTIYVTTNVDSYKYEISRDLERLFIRMPRVGKLTYNRVGPVPKALLESK